MTLKEAAENTSLPLQKWEHYWPVYEEILRPYCGKECTLVELGVNQGGSLDLWRSWLGAKSRIVGVDLWKREVPAECEFVQADLGTSEGLACVSAHIRDLGGADVIIDDASHLMAHQIAAFRKLYGLARGWYVVEDTHTSYHANWGGEYRGCATWIEFAKGLIDHLHGFYKCDGIPFSDVTKRTRSIRFVDSMTIFEVGERDAPVQHPENAKLSHE